MPVKKKKKPDTTTTSTQPSPPDSLQFGDSVPWVPGRWKGKKDEEMGALEAIYLQLIEVRRVVDQMAQQAREEKIRQQLEVVPVRVSDLMQGFQAAAARANRSTQAGDESGEDIEQMAVKDLEISLSAPIIEGGHASDPVIMLPNIKSVDSETAKLSLKFNIVSVPLKKRS
jgi:hypothetical protein